MKIDKKNEAVRRINIINRYIYDMQNNMSKLECFSIEQSESPIVKKGHALCKSIHCYVDTPHVICSLVFPKIVYDYVAKEDIVLDEAYFAKMLSSVSDMDNIWGPLTLDSRVLEYILSK